MLKRDPFKPYLPVLKTPEQLLGKFKCRPGDTACGKISTDVNANLFGLTPDQAVKSNAWDRANAVVNAGGKKIMDFGNTTPDYNNLSVGDYVIFDRLDRDSSGGKGDQADHVGVVVGLNEQGKPLVYHGSNTKQDGTIDHVVESLDEVGKKYGYDYKARSAYRLPTDRIDYSKLPEYYRKLTTDYQASVSQQTTPQQPTDQKNISQPPSTKMADNTNNKATSYDVNQGLKEFLITQKTDAKGNKAKAIDSLLKELDQGTQFGFDKQANKFSTTYNQGRQAGTNKAGEFIGGVFGINKRKLAENALLTEFMKQIPDVTPQETQQKNNQQPPADSPPPSNQSQTGSVSGYDPLNKPKGSLLGFDINSNLNLDLSQETFDQDLKSAEQRAAVTTDEGKYYTLFNTILPQFKEKFKNVQTFEDSSIATDESGTKTAKGNTISFLDEQGLENRFLLPYDVGITGETIISQRQPDNTIKYFKKNIRDVLKELNVSLNKKGQTGLVIDEGSLNFNAPKGYKTTFEEKKKETPKKVEETPDWETEDYIRLGAVAGDVLGSLTSVVPVAGTTTSSVLGLGSTLGYALADWKDEDVSATDALMNLGVNAALDVGTFFTGPLAKSAKVGKALTSALPLFKKAISAGLLAGGAYGTMSNSDQYGKIFDKIESGNFKEISSKELELLAQGLAVITGVGNMARQGLAKTKEIEVDTGKVDEQGNPVKETKTVLDIDKAALKDSAGNPISTKYSYTKPTRDKKVGAAPWLSRKGKDLFGKTSASVKTFIDPIRNRATRSLAFDSGKRQAASDYYGNIRTNVYRSIFGGSEFKPLGNFKSGTDFTYTGNFKSTPTIQPDLPVFGPNLPYGPLAPNIIIPPKVGRNPLTSDQIKSLKRKINIQGAFNEDYSTYKSKGFDSSTISRTPNQGELIDYGVSPATKQEYDLLKRTTLTRKPLPTKDSRVFANFDSQVKYLSRPHQYQNDTDGAFHRLVSVNPGGGFTNPQEKGMAVFNKVYPDGRMYQYKIDLSKIDFSKINFYKKGGIVKAQKNGLDFSYLQMPKRQPLETIPKVKPISGKSLLDLDTREISDLGTPTFKDKIANSFQNFKTSISRTTNPSATRTEPDTATRVGKPFKETKAGELLSKPGVQEGLFLGAQLLAQDKLLNVDVPMKQLNIPNPPIRPIEGMSQAERAALTQRQGYLNLISSNPAATQASVAAAQVNRDNINASVAATAGAEYRKDRDRYAAEQRKNHMVRLQTEHANTATENELSLLKGERDLENKRQRLADLTGYAANVIGRGQQKQMQQEYADRLGVSAANLGVYEKELARLKTDFKDDPDEFKRREEMLKNAFSREVNKSGNYSPTFQLPTYAKKGAALTLNEKKMFEQYKSELKKEASRDKAKEKEYNLIAKASNDRIKETLKALLKTKKINFKKYV